MINKFKTLAIAMIAAGATVATTMATPVTYSATNVIQPVTVTLTVYAQGSSDTTVATGAAASFKTANLLTAVTNAMGSYLGKKSEIAVLTSAIRVETGTTNVTTNVVSEVTNTITVNTNLVVIANSVTEVGAGTTNVPSTVTNVTVGDTSGAYVAVGTNIVVVTPSDFGPVTNTYSLASNSIVIDPNNTASVGTNGSVAIAVTNTSTPIDTTQVTVFTNGGTSASYTVGTNTVFFTTNSVIIGTTTNIFTTNAEVTYGSAIIYSNGAALGFATSTNFSDSLTSTILTNLVLTTNLTTNLPTGPTGPGVTNTTVSTNLAIVASTTDLATNTVTLTNAEPVYATNVSTELAVVNGPTNTAIPTNILSLTTEPVPTDIVASTAHSETDYSIKRLVLFGGTSNAPLDLKAQGLVKSTAASVTESRTLKVAVTNEAWSDVSGYGTNVSAPFVVGGTVTVGAPAEQKVPTGE